MSSPYCWRSSWRPVSGGELDRSELDKRLNALGADGWESEKLLTRMALHGEKDGHLLIFRRERI